MSRQSSRKRSLCKVDESNASTEFEPQSKRQKTDKTFTISDQWLPVLSLEEKKQCNDIASALYNLNQSPQLPDLIVQEIAIAAVGSIQHCHICSEELLDLLSELEDHSFISYESDEYPHLKENLFYCEDCFFDSGLPRCNNNQIVDSECINPCRKDEFECRDDRCEGKKCPLHSKTGRCGIDGCEAAENHSECLQKCANCEVTICSEHTEYCSKVCCDVYCLDCFSPAEICDLCTEMICKNCQSDNDEYAMSVCKRESCPEDYHSICKRCGDTSDYGCVSPDDKESFARAHSWLKCSEEHCIEKVCCFGEMSSMVRLRFRKHYKSTMKENQCRECTKLFCSNHINYDSENEQGYCAVCLSLFET